MRAVPCGPTQALAQIIIKCENSSPFCATTLATYRHNRKRGQHGGCRSQPILNALLLFDAASRVRTQRIGPSTNSFDAAGLDRMPVRP